MIDIVGQEEGREEGSRNGLHHLFVESETQAKAGEMIDVGGSLACTGLIDWGAYDRL